VGVSTTGSSISQSNAASGTKPRVWSVAGTYTNGPLYVTLAYENHSNFGANTTQNPTGYNGSDKGWHAGVAYQFGPVKVGGLYVDRKYDASANGATDVHVKAWNLAGEWNIQGPHALRGGYTKADDTSGSAGAGLGNAFAFGAQGGTLTANGGAGGTGGHIWQIQYVYNASKRTEFTVGYVNLSNDGNARYSLGGLSSFPNNTVQTGQSQDAIAVSIKNTF
jgi:predicted porin